MNSELLKELSNADSVASVEDEVRSILYRELAKYSDEVFSDRLGSIIFHKKGTSPNPLKIMFCAHIDEVGFMVRHISDIGFVYLVTFNKPSTFLPSCVVILTICISLLLFKTEPKATKYTKPISEIGGGNNE